MRMVEPQTMHKAPGTPSSILSLPSSPPSLGNSSSSDSFPVKPLSRMSSDSATLSSDEGSNHAPPRTYSLSRLDLLATPKRVAEGAIARQPRLTAAGGSPRRTADGPIRRASTLPSSAARAGRTPRTASAPALHGADKEPGLPRMPSPARTPSSSARADGGKSQWGTHQRTDSLDSALDRPRPLSTGRKRSVSSHALPIPTQVTPGIVKEAFLGRESPPWDDGYHQSGQGGKSPPGAGSKGVSEPVLIRQGSGNSLAARLGALAGSGSSLAGGSADPELAPVSLGAMTRLSSSPGSMARLSSATGLASSPGSLAKASQPGSRTLVPLSANEEGVGRRLSGGSAKPLMVDGLKGSQAGVVAAKGDVVEEPKVAVNLKLELRGKRIRYLTSPAVRLTQRLEWVNLRDNKLQTLQGVEVLRRIKVLNLSFNELRDTSLEALGTLPTLQHLHLTGNKLTSLEALPALPNLEYLNVQQNALSSLAIPPSPKLKAINASRNNIASLRDLPHNGLPMLESLRVDSNPVMDLPHPIRLAVVLVGRSLSRFNGAAISDKDLSAGLVYPPHAAACLRAGWEPPAEEEMMQDSLSHFHGSLQSHTLPTGYTLKAVRVHDPAVGEPCKCVFEFGSVDGGQDEGQGRVPLTTVCRWMVGSRYGEGFKAAEGLVDGMEYWPVREDAGMCLWVECTPSVGGVGYPPVFATSVEVAPGDGIPKILEVLVHGEALEGMTLRGAVKVAWSGGTPTDGVISWWRVKGPGAVPVVIPGASTAEYTLTAPDVGMHIWYMHVPVTAEGAKGEARFAQTAVVKAGFPCVLDVQLEGEPTTGQSLKGKGQYFGGEEGDSQLRWMLQDTGTGALLPLNSVPESGEYTIREADVGRRIVLEYLPVSSEGVVGDAVRVASDIVKLGPPAVDSVTLVGDLMEVSSISVTARYTGGGEEGPSKIVWFRTMTKAVPSSITGRAAAAGSNKGGIDIIGEGKNLVVPASSVGWYLGVEYTPVRVDGVEGAAVVAVSDAVVNMCPPMLTGIGLEGTLQEGEVLEGYYVYVGQMEGTSDLGWYLHKDPSDPGTFIPDSHSRRRLTLTRQMVSHFVSFRCTPRRTDGAEGPQSMAMSGGVVLPVPLPLPSVSIRGTPLEGETLTMDVPEPKDADGASLWAQYKQEIRLQWYQTRPGSEVPCLDATSPSYVLEFADIGCAMACECTLVDTFGRTTGPLRAVTAEVEAAPPSVSAVVVTGEAVSGRTLRGEGKFKGGVEGMSRFQWFLQEGATGPLLAIPSTNDSREYVVREGDVRKRIVFQYTPVNNQGEAGPPATATTEIVQLAPPEVGPVSLEGSLVEGARLSVRTQYVGGGREGGSEVRWFRSKTGTVEGSMEEIGSLVGAKDIVVPLHAVDWYIGVKLIPARADGTKGLPVLTLSKTPVQSLPPTIADIWIEGEAEVGTVLSGSYTYVGGYEGLSQCGWYLHTTASEPGTLIPGSVGLRERLLTTHECGKLLSFRCTPKRSDGTVGEMRVAMTSREVLPASLALSELIIQGTVMEGQTLRAVPVAAPGLREAWETYRSETNYQWYRSEAGFLNMFEIIPGQQAATYTVQLADVGRILRCTISAVDRFKRTMAPKAGESAMVKAAPPSVRDVEITGSLTVGSTLCGSGSFFGGKEGASTFQWLREGFPAGTFAPLPVPNNSTNYTLTDADLGHRIAFKYSPVNVEGELGEPVQAVSQPIRFGPPTASNVSIVGSLMEGSMVTAVGTFNGPGTEGRSLVQWYRAQSPADTGVSLLELSPPSTSRDFILPQSAVGWYLVATYTPVRSDGDAGAPVSVTSAAPVQGLPPRITSIAINGRLAEGELITASYQYTGGVEGSSQFAWYIHLDENDPGQLIPSSVGLRERVLSRNEVGRLLSFRCSPRRQDGVEGEPRTAMRPERVVPGMPRCRSLAITGFPTENAVLRAEKDYSGGHEGASIYRWYLTLPGDRPQPIDGVTTSTYRVRVSDMDAMISASCTPVRSDGLVGETVYAAPVGPVGESKPRCDGLELEGLAKEGGALLAKAAYRGGDQGACSYQWMRIDPSGRETLISTNERVNVSAGDVGCTLRCTFTPVRADGTKGSPVSATSAVVEDGDPTGYQLVLPTCHQAQEATPSYSYKGGREGTSRWVWYRSDKWLADPEAALPSLSTIAWSRSYTPCLEDVRCFLVVQWQPTRADGKQGKPLVAITDEQVAAANPEVYSVAIEADTASNTFRGRGQYYGGIEGASVFGWWRKHSDGHRKPISGATSPTYQLQDDDYGCQLIFSYTPVRIDGYKGMTASSEPTATLLPDMLVPGSLEIHGAPLEREMLTAVVSWDELKCKAEHWNRFLKASRFTWYRETEDGSQSVVRQSSSSPMYRLRLADVGCSLTCECVLEDQFGRFTLPLVAASATIQPGYPRVERLLIYGSEIHGHTFTAKGEYSGGVKGASTFQWYRAMAGSWKLEPIQGATSASFVASVDEIGYILAVQYTPIRNDGTAGEPEMARTNPIDVEPAVQKSLALITESNGSKFDVLRVTPTGTVARVADVNAARLKLVRTSNKISRAVTDVKTSYKKPFWVDAYPSDPYKAVVLVSDSETVELVLHTRQERDTFVLALRRFAQKYR